jgi:hypothetical protein
LAPGEAAADGDRLQCRHDQLPLQFLTGNQIVESNLCPIQLSLQR